MYRTTVNIHMRIVQRKFSQSWIFMIIHVAVLCRHFWVSLLYYKLPIFIYLLQLLSQFIFNSDFNFVYWKKIPCKKTETYKDYWQHFPWILSNKHRSCYIKTFLQRVNFQDRYWYSLNTSTVLIYKNVAYSRKSRKLVRIYVKQGGNASYSLLEMNPMFFGMTPNDVQRLRQTI